MRAVGGEAGCPGPWGPTRVWVGVLGPLEVRIEGEPIELPRGGARILLATLAVDPARGLSNEALVDRLWGEAAPRSALFSLRNLVARLRALLGADAISLCGNGYRLGTGVSTDLQQFEHLLASGHSLADHDPASALIAFEQALTLLRGRPFAESDYSVEVVSLARRVEEQASVAEESWAAVRLGLGRVGRDLPRFQEAVDRQPLRETRWVHLVDALAQSGRRVEALRAAQRAHGVLRQAGLLASAELLAAEQRALCSHSDVPAWTPGAMRLEEHRITRIVGRDSVLERLDPLPPLCVVSGEKGAGKTRLLAELAGRERNRGALVLYVAARPRESGTHFLRDLAAEFIAAHDDLDVQRELESLAGLGAQRRASVHPLADVRSARILSAFRQLIERVPSLDTRPVVVLLDDLYLLDSDTLRRVIDILRAIRADLRLVVTWGASGPDPGVVTCSGQIATTIELAPLEPEYVHELLSDTVPIEAVSDVVALGSGNPALVMEASRQLARIGPAVPHPKRLDEIVRLDLERRSLAELDVLNVIRLLGRPAQGELIAEVVGCTTDVVSRILRKLAESRLINSAGRDGAVIRLNLVETQLAQITSETDVDRLRESLIDALRRRDDVVPLAEQLLARFDGSIDAATEISRIVHQVLRRCIDMVDYGTALDIGTRYLDAVGATFHGVIDLEIQLLVATSMIAQGDVQRGKALLDAVMERCDEAGNHSVRADVILALGPLQTGSSRAGAIAEQAEAAFFLLSPDDIVRRVQLATWAAHHRINRGERERALGLIAQVSKEAAASPLPTWRSLVLLTLAHAEFCADGSPAGVLDRTGQLRSWAALTGDESALAASATLSLGVGYLDGTLDDVETALESVISASLRFPRSDLRWIPRAVEAGVALARGDLGRAPSLIEDAELTGQRVSAAGAAPMALVHKVLCARLDGSFGRLSPFLEPNRQRSTHRSDVIALWGLAAVDIQDHDTVARAAVLLNSRPDPLITSGLLWPISAMALAEISWSARHTELAETLWHGLRRWSGRGLSVLGMAYAGAADTWLGVAAALTGRTDTARALLDAAIDQEDRRGAVPWRRRAEQLRNEIFIG